MGQPLNLLKIIQYNVFELKITILLVYIYLKKELNFYFSIAECTYQ